MSLNLDFSKPRAAYRLSLILTVMIFGLLSSSLLAQETTGGLQGSVKDPSGAVVANAHVVLTGTSMIGDKVADTDNSGNYHFANLPPGSYTMTVTAKGFSTMKHYGLAIEVGHLPTVDVTLEVGTTSTVVEVSGEAPVIDVTTNTNQTNITSDVIQNVPHGNSFQSMIQFAPMARNEPLAGMTQGGVITGGTGGSLPGSTGNGQQFGYSVGGGADSENSYLVEGQDTENISGGYSKANVPFEFIQEVQIKTSGIEAEHGGALGGVVNVIMKKGGNGFHGQLFTNYETSGADASPTPYLRYDINSTGSPDNPANTSCGGGPCGGFDAASQEFQFKKDHFRTLQPGFTVGGPIVKNRLWFFLGSAPFIQSMARSVDFSGSGIPGNAILGKQYFTQDTQTYYTTARLDASLTQKIRVFGSWLYQYARQTGANPPRPDSAFAGQSNPDINTPVVAYSHGIGWSAPNATYNVGADFTLNPRIVSTTRFGYFFENYHDFGWQTSTPNLDWRASGIGQTDRAGNPLPLGLQQNNGTTTAPYNQSYTKFNANKHYQFDQDVAIFKSGWGGAHNFRFGYQFNRLNNVINQNGNVPLLRLYPGAHSWFPFTSTGTANCAALKSVWGHCSGQDGYAYVLDFATILPASAVDNNHALFVQDAWNVGHGFTLNLGLRAEKEYLPAPGGYKNLIKTINFQWSDKLAPRLGAAWGSANGNLKIFGSYGVVNDVMKLLLAQTSYGAQSYEECAYALGPNSSGAFNPADFSGLVFNSSRACPNGTPSTGANWANGTPASLMDAGSGVSLIENINLRPWEPSAPGIKPYRQHEYVAGVDYQLRRNWALEARYDRRRLDHILEDASLNDPFWGETYTIVNPGEGVNRTLDGYAAYMASIGEKFGVPNWSFNGPFTQQFVGPFGTCPTCPPNPKAVRNYDGLEIRLTKTMTHGWAGMFSYTWSSLWGNYTGLTNTDQQDGGLPGRNSPDTSRAFDEPFYYFGANGKSNNGPLPTDRPSTFKGYVYYTLPWKGMNTNIGLFQTAYQGIPAYSYIDVGTMFPGQVSEAVAPFGRDKWVNMTQDPTTGAITLGTPYTRRTPWYTQTDFNIGHHIKTGEHQTLGFDVTFQNLLNQRAVTSYYGGMNSVFFTTPLIPGPTGFLSNAASYQTLEGGYNVQQWINGNAAAGVLPVTKSAWYGQPFTYQLSRGIRFGVNYSF